MPMLLVTPAFRANLPTSSPNSSSLLVNLRNNPSSSSYYSRFPSSLRPLILAEEIPHQPGIQVDDAESGAGVDSVKASEAGTSDADESAITTSLRLYKEALLQNNDETKLAEIEALFKSIEDAKYDLEKKVVSLSQELTVEKIRVVRISAEFDNFRRSTETERLSLATSAQGEIVEKLLPVLDNFKRAKTEMKVATEGEEKINNSYQSIYKQFAEILASVDVVPVETMVQNRVGLNPIDRLLGKMQQLLNHSFFRVYIIGVMFGTFAILTLCVG